MKKSSNASNANAKTIMYSKEDLIRDIEKAGVKVTISNSYGKGAVLELNLKQEYKFVVATSSIYNDEFYGITYNVIKELDKDNNDYALVLVNTLCGNIWIYDYISAKKLLTAVSQDVNHNYKILKKDLDPNRMLTPQAFFEFVQSQLSDETEEEFFARIEKDFK